MEYTADSLDRIEGVLVATAAGDALGAGYEFTVPGAGVDIRMRGGGPFGFAPGEWTDDTAMTVAVAQGAVAGDLRGDGLDAAAAGFQRWYAGAPKDIGNQTRVVLTRAASDAASMTAAAADLHARTGRTGGNGSLMRTAPVALRYLDDPDACVDAARRVSDLTHADPHAGQACALWSYSIRHAVVTGTFDGPRLYLEAADAVERDFWSPLLDAAEAGPPTEFAQNGWVVHALQTAWWAISTTDASGPHHLVAALETAVRAGNDTDTTAAIAGGLLGARWGRAAVPGHWQEKLHGWPRMRVDELASLAREVAAAGGA
ncbi:ADP-ribosylglycohydrolase family protein [Tsukamurella sp. 8F]|uniref:ADP-ribosylglycohydrolase family protein n=1 Tax=unclassified Tsukamurella TaxID=2633480 RepID=UPI0023B8F7E5|nr:MULTISPECIES: ADP-ribosylglycohydrolase family protein [unclassified Tsukamurella]MDF0530697.1 ADP-ribosylglycohydrolase family protein [Tsukamurella sp. 8J]MDF0587898.1 ADP-ribosylglycohydrolase family protein [Tsukamurella sp. 8F]